MKKMKLLTSLVGLTGLSVGLVPMISGCSCGNKQITPELTGDKGVKIKESNIVKGKESTITLTIPQGKEIDTLTITIGNKQLKQGTDFTVDSNNKITIKAEAVTGENVTITVKIKDKIIAKPFADTDLSVIIAAIQTFEASAQDETAMKALCAKFSDTTYESTGTTVEEHLINFIGKETTIKINELDHVIRVIGINHDELSSSTPESTKYAAFTFETVTLYSNYNAFAPQDPPSGVYSPFDDTTETNVNYINSVLKQGLSAAGGSFFINPSILESLPSNIQTAIQSVKKQVAISKDSGSTYNVTTYDDKIFPLTYTEMAQQQQTGTTIEGKSYKYWEKNNSNEARIKMDVTGQARQYWLCSPITNNKEQTQCINADGTIGTRMCGSMQTYISFAFCI